MSPRHLPASPETCHWGFLDAALPPVLRIASGDTVTIETVSGGPDIVPDPASGFDVLDAHRRVLDALTPRLGRHIMTGPVAVEGAEPGDVLQIDILDISLGQDWGWTVMRPGMGTLPEDFPSTRLFHTAIDAGRGVGVLPWGAEIALAPFFGILGVAPRPELGAVSSVEPREFGGNIDLKELVAGTTLYLPVWAPGALFSAGDGHAAQGDGEVCLTALETALRGTFRLTVRKDLRLTLPIAETPRHAITLGFDPDLDEAARQALRAMIALVTARSGLDAEQAYALCSLAADLRVTQLVDGSKGIHVMLDRRWLMPVRSGPRPSDGAGA